MGWLQENVDEVIALAVVFCAVIVVLVGFAMHGSVPEMPEWFVGVIMLVMGYYFGKRVG